MEENKKEKHTCFAVSGIIIDVTFRQDGTIYCRRCHKQLTREQVDPDILNGIDIKLQKRNQR